MQYVWQHRLWLPSDMTTVDGERVEVLDPGLLNNDAGPDFFNAKIRIGGRMWAGNVEIHVKASDWHRHGHDSDPAYDSVILHVVEHNDVRINRNDGSGQIPQLVMPCAADFSRSYHEMVNNPVAEVPCAAYIKTIPGIYLTDWLSALGFERLYEKADRVSNYAQKFNGDWGQVIYITLARALGFSTNSEPFERLAAATPLRQLMRHRDSLVTIEGALFGQAGFLDKLPDDAAADHYVQRMKEEYAFVSHKYALNRPQYLGWKMGRMRPQNFPHRRIATLAAMIADGFSIGYNLLHVRGEDDARALFDIELRGYWSRRYNFGAPSASSVRALSRSSISTLIINVVAPVLYAYGNTMGKPELCDRAIDLLHTLAPEDNTFVRLFTAAGIDCRDAFTSQAIVQLRRNYCEGRKCLYCRIGHRYLAQKALRRPSLPTPT